MSDEPSLEIALGPDHVGDLVLLPNDVTEFRIAPAYRKLVRRPVLGQVFEDDLNAVHRARMRLPPFFSNLLPEGRLRQLVADRLNVAPDRESFLLARLGDDLPGDVRVVPRGIWPTEMAEASSEKGPENDGPLKFSLAGVQLKLSMVREGRGMTLPASGRGGDWIVKLPGAQYRGVPENEHATMSWAALSGIEVPPIELVSMSALKGIPPEIAAENGMAFAVRRFDRPSPGARTHIEDFAQVRDVYPEARGKYRSTNYETIGKIILNVAGQESFEEFVRRLAFIIVSANADAHVKNWSFIYPDRVTARLSPAYDLVSTLEFIERDALALNLAKTKSWQEMSLEHFTRFAQRVGADPESVAAVVEETVRRALDAWPTIRRDHSVSKLLTERLEHHWKSVPLIARLENQLPVSRKP